MRIEYSSSSTFTVGGAMPPTLLVGRSTCGGPTGFALLDRSAPARGFDVVVAVCGGAFCDWSRWGPPYGHAVSPINSKEQTIAFRTMYLSASSSLFRLWWCLLWF